MKHSDDNVTEKFKPLPTNSSLVTLKAGVEVKLSSHHGSSNEVWYALINNESK